MFVYPTTHIPVLKYNAPVGSGYARLQSKTKFFGIVHSVEGFLYYGNFLEGKTAATQSCQFLYFFTD